MSRVTKGIYSPGVQGWAVVYLGLPRITEEQANEWRTWLHAGASEDVKPEWLLLRECIVERMLQAKSLREYIAEYHERSVADHQEREP